MMSLWAFRSGRTRRTRGLSGGDNDVGIATSKLGTPDFSGPLRITMPSPRGYYGTGENVSGFGRQCCMFIGEYSFVSNERFMLRVLGSRMALSD